ncbi:MAG: hypothetical protein SOU51_00575 [Collinsella sp.]|nr:hypothetical protein [Collinsella sp.]
MPSNKRSARAKQRAAFEAGFDASGMGDLFAREHDRKDRLDAQHEAALKLKACESKNRYSSRAEALDAIAACADHGRRGLHVYRCPYCNGWHLTSHPQDR